MGGCVAGKVSGFEVGEPWYVVAMPAGWTQADIDTLRKAIATGARIVEYEGPPKRHVEYQDIQHMRDQLAIVVAAVDQPTSARVVSFAKGFRGSEFK